MLVTWCWILDVSDIELMTDFVSQACHQRIRTPTSVTNMKKPKSWPNSEIQQEASGEQWKFITTLNHWIDDLIQENDATKENFDSINERSKKMSFEISYQISVVQNYVIRDHLSNLWPSHWRSHLVRKVYMTCLPLQGSQCYLERSRCSVACHHVGFSFGDGCSDLVV